jgi:hypothetical protein
LFTALGVIALLFASLYLWLKKHWLFNVANLFVIIGCVVLLSLGYSYYFSPIEAIFVKSSALYRDAGEQYAKVNEEPVPSGNKVKVLGHTEAGKWIKVQTNDGTIGYVPYEALRIL